MIPYHDTLYAHHSYASHLPQKLDQLVSTYLDSGPWKIRFGRRAVSKLKPEDMGGDELCEYNAADCRLTAATWNAIQKDLEAERHVYEHDLCLAQLCTDMTLVGIRVDVERQGLLSRKLQREADAYRAEMRKLLRDSKFQPGKPDAVRRALYEILQIKVLKLTPKGMPSTGKEVLEALRGDEGDVGRFATLLTKRREALKSKSTYVDAIKPLMFEAGPFKDEARAHYSWGPREKRDQKTSGGGHTVSGRLAGRLQSAPKYNEANTPDRAREQYIAAPGNELVYFDVKQGEPRVAAFLSGDSARIKATLGDVHSENAKIMFPEVAQRGWLDPPNDKDMTRGAPCRHLAKQMGLAIDYFAEGERVWSYLLQNRFDSKGRALYGAPSLNSVNAIIAKIRFAYRVYVKFVHGNLARVRKCGWMRSPILGRLRWLGRYTPITDVANYPIQSCLADIMNLRSLALAGIDRFKDWARLHPEIMARVGLLKPETWPRLPRGVHLVAQIHDAVIYDTPKALVPTMKRIISDYWSREIDLPGGKLVLPVDLKSGARWSEL